MAPKALTPLLKLPAAKRAELALALWESLDDSEREAAFPMTDELGAELDRRTADHVSDPSTSIPWPVVRRKLSKKR
jgi:putative addiction module component (TIGR02574 family)